MIPVEMLLEECENKSTFPETNDYFDVNEEIRWYSNAVGDFKDDKISEFYLNDTYSKNSRWDLWQEVVQLLNKHQIKTNLDIGCANNHFSYLCIKKGINSIGLEPRKFLVKQNNENFSRLGISEKCCYIGNIRTFNESFENVGDIKFDCVTILNFLHGNGHHDKEIVDLIQVLSNVTKFVVATLPQSHLGQQALNQNFEIIDTTKVGLVPHTMFRNRKIDFLQYVPDSNKEV